MDPDSGDELHYIDAGARNGVPAHRIGGNGLHLLSSSTEVAKSLGTWIFDKKNRERKYIALTGKMYTGAEAMHAARADKTSENNPTRTTRNELKRKMALMSPEVVLSLSSTNASLDQPLTQLSNWGLPNSVVARYAQNKVTKLFPWQIECLTVDSCKVLSGAQHLIYSAPTSGGKTLVSEILMLRRLAQCTPAPAGDTGVARCDDAATHGNTCTRHTIFFVVPFVALAEEKAAYFQEMWQDMNIGVKAFHGDGGDITGNTLSEDIEVAVCTIERANILLTQLLDEGREDQLKMVVVDEVHMLTDAHRGFLLEVMLSKVKYLLNSTVQVVGMSATLPNIADLAGWLGASLYTTQYRPVDLSVRVCMNKTLYNVTRAETVARHSMVAMPDPQMDTETGENNNGAEATVPLEAEVGTTITVPIVEAGPSAEVPITVAPPAVTALYTYDSTVGLLPEDPDGMKRLCLDTVASGKSAMLFCNSKRRCEVCAVAVADAIRSHMHLVAASYRPSQAVRQGRLALVEALSQTQVGLCPVLRQTLPHGVAYHHAGLTLDERKVVEDGFRQGLVQVLCTTSTLSAGVNMPAHRVVIR
jgi:superfamily II RNA helicase